MRSKMNYRAVTDTDIKVSEIGFKIETLLRKDLGRIDKTAILNLLATAFEYGITLYDTGEPRYREYAEELIKESFSYHRHQTIISTNMSVDLYTQNILADVYSRKISLHDYLINTCEESLKSMETDYIDILNISHFAIKNDIESDEVFEALNALQKDGKIRFWGISLDSIIEFEDTMKVLLKYKKSQILQIPSNPIQTSTISAGNHLIGENSDIAIFANQSGCFPILSETKDIKDLFLESNYHSMDIEHTDTAFDQFSERIELINNICKENNISIEELEINHALYNDYVAALLPDIRSKEDLMTYIIDKPLIGDFEDIFKDIYDFV
jgi:aryl-alcohol dehydrogenase-like predicted oxidoreductase